MLNLHGKLTWHDAAVNDDVDQAITYHGLFPLLIPLGVRDKMYM